MRKSSGLILWAALEAAAAPAFAQAPPADLDLICDGTIPRREQIQSNSTTGRFGGQATNANMAMEAVVASPEQLRFTLKGTDGQFAYAHGPTRKFTAARVSPERVSADYKALMAAGDVELNRKTGEIWVTIGGKGGFEGKCKPANPPPPVQLGAERSY